MKKRKIIIIVVVTLLIIVLILFLLGLFFIKQRKNTTNVTENINSSIKAEYEKDFPKSGDYTWSVGKDETKIIMEEIVYSPLYLSIENHGTKDIDLNDIEFCLYDKSTHRDLECITPKQNYELVINSNELEEEYIFGSKEQYLLKRNDSVKGYIFFQQAMIEDVNLYAKAEIN